MIHLVGCGFLGSVFASEAGKRLWAHKQSSKWLCIDGGKFEERNAANQNCYPFDAGTPKAEVISLELQEYQQEAVGVETLITAESIDAQLEGSDLIIDAVDNIEARQLLWMYGRRLGIPVLHMGISRAGSGAVEWSHGEYDTFSLSPIALAGRALPPDPDEKLRPCQLLTHRRIGWMTAHTAAVALTAYLGIDPEETFEPGVRMLTTWSIGAGGVTLRSEQELDAIEVALEQPQ